MSYLQFRIDHAALRAATVLVLLVGLLAAVPAPAGGDESASDSQQRLEQMQAAHAGGTAAQSEVDAQANHPSACFPDPPGDTIDENTGLPAASPQADIREHCVGYESHLNLRVRVAAPSNPSTDPAWQQATFVGWFIDVDGDGDGDFFVDYSLRPDGVLAGARVVDLGQPGSPTACTVDAIFDATWYHAGPIPAGCIGSPGTVAVSVAVFYNPGGQGAPVYRDTAPGGGLFAPPVVRDEDVCTDPLPASFQDRNAIAPVHRPNVDCLFARGIVRGTTGDDGIRRFLPRPNVTRGQFAAFTFRTMTDMGVPLPGPRTPPFADVPPPRVFFEEIHRLAAAQILLGYAHGNLFGPQDPIRRDQTASVLLRASEHALNQPLPPQNPGAYFSDTVGNFHANNIDAAHELGLVFGIRAPAPGQRGLYAPAAHTSRQQMASVLARFLHLLDGAL